MIDRLREQNPFQDLPEYTKASGLRTSDYYKAVGGFTSWFCVCPEEDLERRGSEDCYYALDDGDSSSGTCYYMFWVNGEIRFF